MSTPNYVHASFIVLHMQATYASITKLHNLFRTEKNMFILRCNNNNHVQLKQRSEPAFLFWEQMPMFVGDFEFSLFNFGIVKIQQILHRSFSTHRCLLWTG